MAENSASGIGGALLIPHGSEVQLSNSTLAHNSATAGDAISLDLTHYMIMHNSLVVGPDVGAALIPFPDDSDAKQGFIQGLLIESTAYRSNMISGYGPSDNPYLADATGIAMVDVCALGSPEDPADAYQLKTGSAAIDIGRDDAVPSYVYDVDLAENPRIVNDAIDIGAFEHQGP